MAPSAALPAPAAATLGTRSFTVTATSLNGQTTSRTVSYTVGDVTAPQIDISSPRAGTRVPKGVALTLSYSCRDAAGGSGIAACAGPVASGGHVDTSRAGPLTLTVRARDRAGSRKSMSVEVTIVDLRMTASARSRVRLRTLAGAVPIRCRLLEQQETLGACAVNLYRGATLAGRGRAAGHGAAVNVLARLNQAGRGLVGGSLRDVPLTVRAVGDTGLGPHPSARAVTAAVLRTQRVTTPPGTFRASSGEVTRKGRRLLAALGHRIGDARTVRCIGYTADLGRSPTAVAKALGLARAKLACGVLKRAGVKATLLTSTRATRDPIAPNGTKAGRDKNRRVLIVIRH
jgi:outer membrane protein OmpA-like peptidoglycan-associated protein